MSGCVPDWNVSNIMDVAMHPSDFCSSSANGRWERRLNHSSIAFVPDHDFEELCWENGELLVVMPGQNIKTQKQPHRMSLHRQDYERVPAPLMEEFATENVGTLVPNVVPAGILPDEEMVAWLQYPLDEELPVNYCPDLRIDVSNSPLAETAFGHPSVVISDDNPESQKKLPSPGANVPLEQTFLNSVSPCPPIPVNTIPCGANTTATTSTRTSHSNSVVQHVGDAVVSSEKLASKMQPVTASSHCSQHVGRSSMNFSLFSKPAVTMKANLHDIGMASGPLVSERLKQFDSLILEACSMPVDTARSLQEQKEHKDAFLLGHSASQCLTAPSILHPTENCPSTIEGDAAVFADESTSTRANAGLPNGSRSCLPGDATVSVERVVNDVPEPTITSSSGGSGNSACKHDKFCSIGGKRKKAEVDDLDIQSEALEDCFGNAKETPLSRPMSTKRARAAEVHNQSERRRRDRINEKMKALQELIPNANKTDKASLLEEAIKYLKSLQSQLQMMAYRSGMTVSTKWIPQWVPQMPQMASLPQGGMGMGIKGGIVGMGATSTHRKILPSLPGLVVPGSAVPLVSVPTLSSRITAPQAFLPGPYTSPITPLNSQVLPHPVHLQSQLGRMNKYNPMLLQQHQHP